LSDPPPAPPPPKGNNAVEMQTTATYDAASQEFIIHSPTTLSQKYW
jgi:acyl-CoA oxidase